jgi:hypothetical protein
MTKNENSSREVRVFQILPGGVEVPVQPLSEYKPVWRGPRIVNPHPAPIAIEEINQATDDM